MDKKIYESPEMELVSVVDVIRTSGLGPDGWGTTGGDGEVETGEENAE